MTDDNWLSVWLAAGKVVPERDYYFGPRPGEAVERHFPPHHTIAVWPWAEAPQDLKVLSQNGGDEDWVALVPAKWADMWLPWVEQNGFGSCNSTRHELPTGEVVYIGAHA